jgi:hypothetical protein
MRIPARVAAVVAATVALVLVFGVGYAVAIGNQRQGMTTKLYVASTTDFTTNVALYGTDWQPVDGLTLLGTWQPGDLLVARFDAQTLCTTEGAAGICRVRIGLTGLDAGDPNLEFLPIGADTFALDSATGGPADADAESHAITRYLQVPRTGSGLGMVWAEVSVSDKALRCQLHLAVLTVQIVTPTST